MGALTASTAVETALGALPASVRQPLRARLAGAESLVVLHVRDERFRWMSLVTFPFKLLLWSLILLVVFWWLLQRLLDGTLIDAVEDGAGDDGPPRRPVWRPLPRYESHVSGWGPLYVHRVERPGGSWLPGFLRFRFTVPVHRVELLLSPSEARPLCFPLSGQRRGRATVAALYALASAAGLKFMECNQGPPSLPLHRGDGGLPLMCDPRELDLQWARDEVSAAGFELVATAAGGELRRAHKPLTRGLAWLLLIVLLLVSPAFLWRAGFRRRLRDVLDDVRGRPPGVDVFFVDAEAVGFCYRRGGWTSSRVRVPRSRLHAILFGEALGFDDSVRYEEPRLRLVGDGSVHAVDCDLGDRLGHAIRDLLVGFALGAALVDAPAASGAQRASCARGSGGGASP